MKKINIPILLESGKNCNKLKTFPVIIQKVALNNSNLTLTIILQNTQKLQLLTQIIKTESIYKSNYKAKLEGLVDERPIGIIKRRRKRKSFKMRCVY
jgi:hypothetical protein